MLDIPGYAGRNTTLLFYFLLVVQLSDVLTSMSGAQLLGRRPIAASARTKPGEGFLGGVITGDRGWRGALPRDDRSSPGKPPGLCATITLVGFAGGLTMSAIKRDLTALKDFGTMIEAMAASSTAARLRCAPRPRFLSPTRHFYTDAGRAWHVVEDPFNLK